LRQPRNLQSPEFWYPKGECLSKSRVILCVDDEPTALAVRSRVLSRAGYVVLTASDGAAALELFKCIRADLIIMDHGLPGLSGTQVAAEMKRLKPAVPIVLLSGLLEAPLGNEHADLVITKGMPAAEFLRAVGKLIPQ
jgi:CheY-like chemotaxis protein